MSTLFPATGEISPEAKKQMGKFDERFSELVRAFQDMATADRTKQQQAENDAKDAKEAAERAEQEKKPGTMEVDREEAEKRLREDIGEEALSQISPDNAKKICEAVLGQASKRRKQGETPAGG